MDANPMSAFDPKRTRATVVQGYFSLGTAACVELARAGAASDRFRIQCAARRIHACARARYLTAGTGAEVRQLLVRPSPKGDLADELHCDKNVTTTVNHDQTNTKQHTNTKQTPNKHQTKIKQITNKQHG
jgi:hypothetical protein